MQVEVLNDSVTALISRIVAPSLFPLGLRVCQVLVVDPMCPGPYQVDNEICLLDHVLEQCWGYWGLRLRAEDLGLVRALSDQTYGSDGEPEIE
jgi:hypothetical protein